MMEIGPFPEAEFEDEIEAEDAPLFWYYWATYHQPPNGTWAQKSVSQAFQLTSAQADYLDQQALIQSWQQVRLSPGNGTLYVGRFNWNGTNWYRDRCHMMDVLTNRTWGC